MEAKLGSMNVKLKILAKGAEVIVRSASTIQNYETLKDLRFTDVDLSFEI